jgi:hypothetical protein
LARLPPISCQIKAKTCGTRHAFLAAAVLVLTARNMEGTLAPPLVIVQRVITKLVKITKAVVVVTTVAEMMVVATAAITVVVVLLLLQLVMASRMVTV